MADSRIYMRPLPRRNLVMSRPSEFSTFRVISLDFEGIPRERWNPLATSPAKDSYYSVLPCTNVLGQQLLPHETNEFRHNRPNPDRVGFLRVNAHTLNDPVCFVGPGGPKQSGQYVWPYKSNCLPSNPRDGVEKTTAMVDYQYKPEFYDNIKNTRHSSNPNKIPAIGVVPVTYLRAPDGSQSFWKEGISYEHQYDSRSDPNYRIRGRRQGGFVWKKASLSKTPIHLSNCHDTYQSSRAHGSQLIHDDVTDRYRQFSDQWSFGSDRFNTSQYGKESLPPITPLDYNDSFKNHNGQMSTTIMSPFPELQSTSPDDDSVGHMTGNVLLETVAM